MPNESFSSRAKERNRNQLSLAEEDILYEEESEMDSLILDEKIESNLGDYVW